MHEKPLHMKTIAYINQGI